MWRGCGLLPTALLGAALRESQLISSWVLTAPAQQVSCHSRSMSQCSGLEHRPGRVQDAAWAPLQRARGGGPLNGLPPARAAGTRQCNTQVIPTHRTHVTGEEEHPSSVIWLTKAPASPGRASCAIMLQVPADRLWGGLKWSDRLSPGRSHSCLVHTSPI